MNDATTWTLVSTQEGVIVRSFQALDSEDAGRCVAGFAWGMGKRRIPKHWNWYLASNVPDAEAVR